MTKNYGQEFKENEKSSKIAKTLAISSGKGGVGKTSIAIKMCLELAKTKKKTLLIDCDFNLSNTQIKLNLPINNYFYQFIKKIRSFEESIFRFDHFHLLSGCNGHLELLKESDEFIVEIIQDLIHTYQAYYDYIILDLPGGLQKFLLELMSKVDDRIIIITPDKSSLTDSYSLIKILKLLYNINKQDILINRVQNEKQVDKISSIITNTSKNFLNLNINILGSIQELNNKGLNFDQLFLFQEENSSHKDFTYFLKKLTDSNEAKSRFFVNMKKQFYKESFALS